MSKNASVILLNDLKKDKKIIEQKYNKQKNKKINIKEKLIYIFGFTGAFLVSCFYYPASLGKVMFTLLGYAIGTPLIYSYIQFGKEIKLKNKLDNINKEIDKLEFEVNGIELNQTYIKENQTFIIDNTHHNQIQNNQNTYNDDFEQEKGPKLTLHK